MLLAFPDGSQQNANRDILPEKNNDPRQWGWYINALKNKPKVYIDNPSIAAATNTHVVSMGRVISYNGTPAIIGADVDIQDVLQQLTNVELPGDGYISVLGKNDTIFAHEDSSLLNQNAQSILDKSQLSLMLENPELQRLTTVDMGGDEYYISIVPLKNDGLKTVAIISKSSVLGSTYETLMILAVGATTAIILFIYIFSRWCRFLYSPLREVTSQLQRIGAGTADLSVKINMASQDEVGQLAASFNAFTSRLAGLLKEIDQKTARLFDYAETSSKSASTINQRLEAQQIETSQVAVATKELTCATQGYPHWYRALAMP